MTGVAVYTNENHRKWSGRIHASCEVRHGWKASWVRVPKISRSERPYLERFLAALDEAGNVIEVAFCNRMGVIAWRRPQAGVEYVIEPEPEPGRALLEPDRNPGLKFWL